MATFIDPNARIEMPIDDENRVWVRVKMSLEVQAAVQRELLNPVGISQAGNGFGPENIELNTAPLSYVLTLLKHNLVKWHGPLFVDELGRPIPCRPEKIALLDFEANEWWITPVVEKISLLNQPKRATPVGETPDPNEIGGGS